MSYRCTPHRRPRCSHSCLRRLRRPPLHACSRFSLAAGVDRDLYSLLTHGAQEAMGKTDLRALFFLRAGALSIHSAHEIGPPRFLYARRLSPPARDGGTLHGVFALPGISVVSSGQPRTPPAFRVRNDWAAPLNKRRRDALACSGQKPAAVFISDPDGADETERKSSCDLILPCGRRNARPCGRWSYRRGPTRCRGRMRWIWGQMTYADGF